MNLSFIIWNSSPEIFSFGMFALRWYGLLFALGFLVSQQILYYMHKKEGKPEHQVDTLTILMVVATILGARLGHVIFYQPELLWQQPMSVLLPFEFRQEFSFSNIWPWLKSIRFTGLMGLASHGGAIGILFALWLYSKYQFSFRKADVALEGNDGSIKKKGKLGLFFTPSIHGQSYLHILDRIVILVAITGAFIRLGNYFNSEIIGKPTDAPWGVVFSSQLSEQLNNKSLERNPIETFSISKNTAITDTLKAEGHVPMLLYFFFKSDLTEDDLRSYIDTKLKNALNNSSDHFAIDMMAPLQYYFIRQDNGGLAVKVPVEGIARHPAQLYESISCVFLFLLLFFIWFKHNGNPPEGRIFGIFLIILWGLRFSYEFLKENQVSFESSLPINMGQILSIPLFIAGIFILLRSYKKAN